MTRMKKLLLLRLRGSMYLMWNDIAPSGPSIPTASRDGMYSRSDCGLFGGSTKWGEAGLLGSSNQIARTSGSIEARLGSTCWFSIVLV